MVYLISSQVYDFSFRTFLAVEVEGAVGNVLRLEVAHRYGAPGLALAHLDGGRHVGVLVDGDDQLLYGALLVLGHKANLVVAAHVFQRRIVARLIDVDEGVWVHRHLLGLGRVAHVYLVGVLEVSPLGLAVVPDDGLGCAGVELVALDGERAACRTIFGA